MPPPPPALSTAPERSSWKQKQGERVTEKGGEGLERTRCGSHLQQVLDVSLFRRALDAEKRSSVHLAGLTRLAEGDAARHVMEVRHLIAGTLGPAHTHCLT